jgi:hypothetical protein
MELDELHVDELGAGAVGERVAVPRPSQLLLVTL